MAACLGRVDAKGNQRRVRVGGYLPAWLRAYSRLHLPQLPKQTPRQAHSPTFVPTTAAPSTSHASASRLSHSHPHSHLYLARVHSPRTEITPSTVAKSLLPMSDDTSAPRASRFREHTNTTNSIHPPPVELWKDIGIENLIEKFNEENEAPPKAARPTARRSHSAISTPVRKNHVAPTHTPAGTGVASRATAAPAPPVTPAQTEGTLGRFSRAFASVFGGLTGKRKAANAMVVDAEAKEKERMDERKRAAEAAYYEAKELGLLPAAKVFVRPSMAARMRKDGMPVPCPDSVARTPRLIDGVADPMTPQPEHTPRTPALYHSQSKKDLYKQKKLSKRVSNLESKLALAKRELESVLAVASPVSASTPTGPHLWSENDVSPHCHTLPSSITKKRKATTIDEAETPQPLNLQQTETRSPKRAKSVRKVKRQSSRLSKKNSAVFKEEVIIVVPDGVSVPPIPSLPKDVEGKKTVIKSTDEGNKTAIKSIDEVENTVIKSTDDGYGGLEHEMF
ncbi:hypothetical protein P153DRAFT_397135 [Dothidotthia symphoricarpi CBS 119687]|uniref:Uncharacterized protein n=1 Tax=Dothidotthia symphoricarpi CBS 119687 TaxID=1392245 RepID=A0A6A6ACR4_9PLEO|nr:uncharacterized protein P153DRAFT_397135 [Dothidotthia symphoricarpi CBS 119687]KAF2128915.1 hypothetical protein P153DRAFT_397135 [Dothidotthia symphoricarpi CBS 119687]